MYTSHSKKGLYTQTNTYNYNNINLNFQVTQTSTSTNNFTITISSLRQYYYQNFIVVILKANYISKLRASFLTDMSQWPIMNSRTHTTWTWFIVLALLTTERWQRGECVGPWKLIKLFHSQARTTIKPISSSTSLSTLRFLVCWQNGHFSPFLCLN